jgi:Ca2+-binding RTX toxin-like protein
MASLLGITALLAVTHSASAGPLQQPACFGAVPTIVGTEGPDSLEGTAADDVIAGLGGDDMLVGLLGNDRICGGPGVDTLFGGFTTFGAADPGNDQIDGGPDMDGVIGGLGDDRLIGGEGIDIIAFFDSITTGVNADLASGVATGVGTDTITEFEAISGTIRNDVLTGSAAGDFFFPFPGDDVVRGGAGFDIVTFLAPVQASLATGTAVGEGNDSLSGLEGLGVDPRFVSVLTGNGSDNYIQGSHGNDTIRGSGGNDTLLGLAGDDRMTGGPGFDLVNGGAGNDSLDGGAGVGDTLSYIDAATRVTVTLVNGTGVAGADRDRFTGFEVVAGSQQNDVLTGDAGPNSLEGRGGNDRVLGAKGNDFLDGGGDTDRLSGGPGDDYCLDGETDVGCEIKDRTKPNPNALVAAALVDLRGMLDRLDAKTSAGRGPKQTFGVVGLMPLLRTYTSAAQARTLSDRVQYTTPPTCKEPRGRAAVTAITPPTIVDPEDLGSGQLTLIWQGQLTLRNRVVYETPVLGAVFAGPNVPSPGFTREWRDLQTNRVHRIFSRALSGNGRYLWKAVVSLEEVPGLRSLRTVQAIPPFCPTR